MTIKQINQLNFFNEMNHQERWRLEPEASTVLAASWIKA